MIKSLYKAFWHWSKTGSVYLFSDPHFDDDDCKFMDPEWIPPDDQVALINSICHKNDTLVLLGDVGDLSYIGKLKAGRKVLIMGNHDQSIRACEEVFDEVYAGALFISPKILLSHEPVSLPFCLNIHGHDHNGIESYAEGCKHLNLAANVCGYTPMSLNEIIKSGILHDIDDIHRMTINAAEKRKLERERSRSDG